jgi:hypothetical protein
MSSSLYVSIADRLLAAQVAIDAALTDPELQAALTPFGYDTAALTAARTLYEEAQALVTDQRREYGEQFAATEAVQQAWETADTAYKHSLKLARVIFKDDTTAQTAMGLNGRRKESLSGWLEQAALFYEGLQSDPALVAAMGRFGYDELRVAEEMALVTAVRAANVVQEREKGQAQEATKTRDARLDDLSEWLADFKAVAEVALADAPQQLERLGFGAIP